MHQRHRHVGFLQLLQHIKRVGLVVDDGRGAHMLARVERAAGKDRGQHVAGLDDADHDIDTTVASR